MERFDSYAPSGHWRLSGDPTLSCPAIFLESRMRALVNIRNVWMEHIATVTAFRYSLPVLKIYSVRNVYYRFLVLAANIATQPMMRRSG